MRIKTKTEVGEGNSGLSKPVTEQMRDERFRSKCKWREGNIRVTRVYKCCPSCHAMTQ